MTSFLVAYGTRDGQTAKVAERVATVLTDRGHEVSTVRLPDAPSTSVDDFDAVLVGGPVIKQRHLPAVVEFVERNRDTLADRPTGLFQLSLASGLPLRSARTGAMDYADRLFEETGWRPDQVGLLAGTVAYTQYDWAERLLFRAISALTTGDTDTSRDYEYTDWEKVERFATEFADFVESEREATRPSTIRGRVGRGLDRRRVAALGLAGVGFLVALYLFVSGDRYRRQESTAEGERPRPVEPPSN